MDAPASLTWCGPYPRAGAGTRARRQPGRGRARSERAMHDEQPDLALLGVAEGARHASNGHESHPLVELDGGRVALRDRVELHRTEAGRARPAQGVIDERPPDALTTAPRGDHVVAT